MIVLFCVVCCVSLSLFCVCSVSVFFLLRVYFVLAYYGMIVVCVVFGCFVCMFGLFRVLLCAFLVFIVFALFVSC